MEKKSKILIIVLAILVVIACVFFGWFIRSGFHNVEKEALDNTENKENFDDKNEEKNDILQYNGVYCMKKNNNYIEPDIEDNIKHIAVHTKKI